MSANSKLQSDKEKVWEKLLETEADRRFNEILDKIYDTVRGVEEASGHKKDE